MSICGAACFHSKLLAQISAIRQMSRGRVKNLRQTSCSMMWQSQKTKSYKVDMRPMSTFHRSTSGRGVSESCRGWGLVYALTCGNQLNIDLRSGPNAMLHADGQSCVSRPATVSLARTVTPCHIFRTASPKSAVGTSCVMPLQPSLHSKTEGG